MAEGGNASEKLLGLFGAIPSAFGNLFPSFDPLDLLVGLTCGLLLRLAVYLRSKNAKKYRHNVEYGAARWGTSEDIRPYIDPKFQNNVILTQTEHLTMNSRRSGASLGTFPAGSVNLGHAAQVRSLPQHVVAPAQVVDPGKV